MIFSNANANPNANANAKVLLNLFLQQYACSCLEYLAEHPTYDCRSRRTLEEGMDFGDDAVGHGW